MIICANPHIVNLLLTGNFNHKPTAGKYYSGLGEPELRAGRSLLRLRLLALP